jgi:hypothetical protein
MLFSILACAEHALTPEQARDQVHALAGSVDQSFPFSILTVGFLLLSIAFFVLTRRLRKGGENE